MDTDVPVVNMDEQPVQFLADTYPSMPMAPGQILRKDYQYKPNGSVRVFLFTEVLRSWHQVTVWERQTAID